MKNDARKHIASFPVIDSHYCRANCQRKYLEERLSISLMYKLFQREYGVDQSILDIVGKQMYSRIFNEELNYGFFKPKKDLYGLNIYLPRYTHMHKHTHIYYHYICHLL